MNITRHFNVILWILLAIGFYGAASVSYANATGHPCPAVAAVPICYLVLFAYAAMVGALLIRRGRIMQFLFCIGWGTAFLIALVGSLAELFAGGGVCPVAGGGSLRGAASTSIPMCFLSLALLAAILPLFLSGPYRRACDVHAMTASRHADRADR